MGGGSLLVVFSGGPNKGRDQGLSGGDIQPQLGEQIGVYWELECRAHSVATLRAMPLCSGHALASLPEYLS